jgi:hypothetical protein
VTAHRLPLPQKLRQELNDIALTKCRDITAQFAECARANGYLVAFRCREQNHAMNECLHQYTNEEQFTVYREKREKEIAAQVAADLAAAKAASS